MPAPPLKAKARPRPTRPATTLAAISAISGGPPALPASQIELGPRPDALLLGRWRLPELLQLIAVPPCTTSS
jgi:hypothetical protein